MERLEHIKVKRLLLVEMDGKWFLKFIDFFLLFFVVNLPENRATITCFFLNNLEQCPLVSYSEKERVYHLIY